MQDQGDGKESRKTVHNDSDNDSQKTWDEDKDAKMGNDAAGGKDSTMGIDADGGKHSTAAYASYIRDGRVLRGSDFRAAYHADVVVRRGFKESFCTDFWNNPT